MRGIRIIATTIVLAAMAYGAAAAAQNRASREAFFRCKDRNGQTHYGDSMPPECAGLDTEVLNDRGMQVRLIEGEATRAKRLEREAVEAKVRKEKEERALRDRTLTETYLSVEDIERSAQSAARAAECDVPGHRAEHREPARAPDAARRADRTLQAVQRQARTHRRCPSTSPRRWSTR